MSVVVAPNAVALPIAPPVPPVTGGGAQSPMQMPTFGGGAAGGVQSPMQVAPSAIQGAAGGGALAQPSAAPVAAPVAAAPAPVVAAPAPVIAPAPAPAPVAAAPVAGGGAANLEAMLPVLTQLVAVLTQLTTALQTQAAQAQAQAGAVGVQGGGTDSTTGTAGAATTAAGSTGVAGEAGTGAAGTGVAADSASVTGGGASTPVQHTAPSKGCGCGMGAAKGAAASVGQAPSEFKPDQSAPAPPATPAAPGKIDQADLKVKGKEMTAEQRRLAEIVLQTGKDMGANKKVLETAVATMIQESVIKNDASVDGKDLDSLGLFQQRPSQGWGTREQISDPKHAARKFFERAIENDKKDPAKAKTLLAQSVQISAFPNAYAQWDKEAERIVADYLG